MTPSMFALYVTCLLLWTMVSIGKPVTLECFNEGGLVVMFYWYKQTPGQKPQLVSKFYKYEKNATLFGEYDDPRLKLDSAPGKNHLKISNVQSSDAGTYYCMGGSSYVYDFIEGIVIHIKSPGLIIPAWVHQSASDEIIQPGGSVTLNCTVHTGTCDGEHSVYWFKHSQQSHPGLIYTHGGRNDQCERKDNTQTHTCVYNLPMKSLNLSHAGTYYCAVASCGHVDFGNRTKLDFEGDEDSLVLVYFLTGTSAVSTTLCVLMAFLVCMTNRRHSCLCTESRGRFSSPSMTTDEGYQNEEGDYDNVSRENEVNRWRRQRDDTWSECVYLSLHNATFRGTQGEQINKTGRHPK